LHEQQEKGSTEAWRRRVFDVYASGEFPGHWPVSQYTDREVMELLNCQDPNLCRPEITRLKKDGLLRELSKTRCLKTGKTVRLCEWTGAAYFSRGNKKQ
jgi:hypothetical protein